MRNEELNFSVNGTRINVWVKAEVSHKTLVKVFEMMRKRGWKIENDKKVDRIIRDDFFVGSKGQLLFKAKKYPAGFNIEFYQEVNIINPNGGYYDFDKLKLMPYLIRCSFKVEAKHIKQMLEHDGYKDDSDPVFQTAEDKVMHLVKTSGHYSEGRTDRAPDYNATDKDGKRLRDGQVKYYRDCKGRLMRGTVYYGLNNMWWVVLNKYDYTNLGCYQLFDLDTEENKELKKIKKSGLHNPKSRLTPSGDEIKQWQLEARKSSKEERIKKTNEMLAHLYSIDWLSRKFQFYIKSTKRIGLQEVESNSFGGHKVFDKPQELKLYTKDLPMSNTESWWISNLKDFVISSDPLPSHWFCKDDNGNGSTAYEWPEIRETLWKMGALVS
ncbi:hypothetical protein V7332_04595 [Bacillus thuringiensis]|uniref:hypothetical protein n=1 Tax=Bacillus thuringiensis TaxID=1428 RepID=UPI002FFECB46